MATPVVLNFRDCIEHLQSTQDTPDDTIQIQTSEDRLAYGINSPIDRIARLLYLFTKVRGYKTIGQIIQKLWLLLHPLHI